MRAWQRAVFAFWCGYCGARLPKGSPKFTVSLPLVTHDRVRCASCAYEPVPAMLPVGFPVPMAATYVDEDGLERPRSVVPASVVTLSDWKSKASGQ